MSARIRLAALAGIAASAAFLWLALRNADLTEIGAVLADANYLWLVWIIPCLVIFYWLKLIRWQLILSHRVSAPAGSLVAPMMIGFAVNNLLPARIGELVRIYFAGKQLRLPQSFVFGTILVERLLDLFAILVLLIVGLAVSENTSETLAQTGYALTTLAVVSFLLLGWATSKPAAFQSFIAVLLRVFPDRIAKRLLDLAMQLLNGLTILRQPRTLALSLANSTIQWLFMAACIEISFRSVGLALPPGASLLCMALVVVSIMLPTAPGFFGAIELAFVVALKPFGVPPETAFSAAILYHLTNYFLVTTTGVALLRRQGLSLKSVQEDVRRDADRA